VLFILLALFPFPLAAETISRAGLTFSDELGGFRLLSVTGSGGIGDPFVVVEEYHGPGPAILTVRGGAGAGGDPGAVLPSMSMLGLSMIKVVTNKGRVNWSSFDVELREVVSHSSPYGDGLSFDQAGIYGGVAEADRFSKHRGVYEPSDRLLFYAGHVPVDDTARLKLFITDPSPTGLFYLVQQPGMAIAGLRRE